MNVGIVEGMFVAVVGRAVDGGHPISPPPAYINISNVFLEPTSQHNSWLNELAFSNMYPILLTLETFHPEISP